MKCGVAGRGATPDDAPSSTRLIEIPDTRPAARQQRHSPTPCKKQANAVGDGHVAPLPPRSFGARRPPLGQGKVRILPERLLYDPPLESFDASTQDDPVSIAMKLSIIDQCPVPAGFTSADAFRNTIELARLADHLGYERYWIAEHHATGAFASPAPEVLIARVGAETS